VGAPGRRGDQAQLRLDTGLPGYLIVIGVFYYVLPDAMRL